MISPREIRVPLRDNEISETTVLLLLQTLHVPFGKAEPNYSACRVKASATTANVKLDTGRSCTILQSAVLYQPCTSLQIVTAERNENRALVLE